MSQDFDVEDIPYWAGEPWWEEPAYARHPPYPAEAVRAAVDSMRRHFDLDWWRAMISACRRNVVAANLIGRGSMNLDFIYNLGTTIGLLENARGFGTKMRELKESDESASILFEIQIAGILAKAGLDVEFPQKGESKSPDIVVKGPGGQAAVECKRLERQEWEHWADALMFSLSQLLSSAKQKNIGIEIHLDPDLANVRMSEKKYPQWNRAIAVALVAQVEQAVNAALQANALPPAEFEIPGIAYVRLTQADNSNGSSVGGIPFSSAAALRKILENGLFDAALQVAGNIPGVVVVHSEHLPDAPLAQVVFDTAVKLKLTGLDNVAALFIVPTRYLFDTRRPLLLLNLRYPRPAGDLEVIRVLRQALNPVIG